MTLQINQHVWPVQDDPDFELIEPAKRQPGVCGWFHANLGPHVCVDRYALFMGSIGGLILSVLLLGVWVGLGTPMGYDNPNWLLIIGTYTGLVSCSMPWHATFFCFNNIVICCLQ